MYDESSLDPDMPDPNPTLPPLRSVMLTKPILSCAFPVVWYKVVERVEPSGMSWSFLASK